MKKNKISKKNRGDGADSPDVRRTAVDILTVSDDGERFVDRVLARRLDKLGWGVPEKRFLTEIVKGTARMRGLLDHYLGAVYEGNYLKVESKVRNILRTGAYQIIFMDSVPDYAALDESVKLAKSRKNKRLPGLVNAVLRNMIRKRSEIESEIEALPDDKRLPIQYSHPSWMVERWLERFGLIQTESMLQRNNEVPRLSVRLNRLRGDYPHFEEIKGKSGVVVRASEYLDGYYTIEGSAEQLPFRALDAGELTVQDVSAGFPVRLLDPEPGMTVIDLCSAPGGKTGAIAELMGDEGRIIAVDRDEYRLSLVAEQVERLGLGSVELIMGDGRTVQLPKADAVLVDAPCTGTGVLSRRADLRWRRVIEDIADLTKLQFELLCRGADLLASGGVLVYSTCSIEDEENWGVVGEFIKSRGDFAIRDASVQSGMDVTDTKGAVATYPFNPYIDGSFCIKLIKG